MEDSAITTPMLRLMLPEDVQSIVHENVHIEFPNGWTASFFSPLHSPKTAAEVWSWKGNTSIPSDPQIIDIENLGKFLTEVASR